MNSKIMNNIQKKINKNDIVYTPQKVVDIMIKDIDINDSIIDSCKGRGAFYNSFKNNNKYYCEINEGKDYFDFTDKVDLNYGNPPYSILSKWLEHSYKITNKKIKFIIGMYSLTPVRLKKAEENGFYLTELILTQIPTWFQRSYIITLEKLDKKPNKINFDSLYLGNKCLYCNQPVGGMRGKNIKHCKRKLTDVECSY